MLSRNMTDNVHQIIKKHIKDWGKTNLLAMDGTLGNGYDLEFLIALNEVASIYGFDIQPQAIEKTKERIGKSHKTVQLIQDSHHKVDTYIKEEIDIALFNLGYLPGGDKKIVTQVETTLNAIEKVIAKLSKGGLLIVMTYPGHPTGQLEHERLSDYLDKIYIRELSVLQIKVINVQKPCPNCFIIINQLDKNI